MVVLNTNHISMVRFSGPNTQACKAVERYILITRDGILNDWDSSVPSEAVRMGPWKPHNKPQEPRQEMREPEQETQDTKEHVREEAEISKEDVQEDSQDVQEGSQEIRELQAGVRVESGV